MMTENTDNNDVEMAASDSASSDDEQSFESRSFSTSDVEYEYGEHNNNEEEERTMTPRTVTPNSSVANDEFYNYKTTVRRQNCCFGFGMLSFAGMFVGAYFLMGLSFSPSNIGIFGDEWTHKGGSGEVGLDADNAETQEIIDEEIIEAEEAGGWGDHGKDKYHKNVHGKKDPFGRKDPFGFFEGAGSGGHHINSFGRDKVGMDQWVEDKKWWLENGQKLDTDTSDMSPSALRKYEKKQKKWERKKKKWGEFCKKNSHAPMCQDGGIEHNDLDAIRDHLTNHYDWRPTEHIEEEEEPEDGAEMADGEIKAISSQFTVLKQVKHDPESFTQGLAYKDDGSVIFETTGLYRHSKVRRIHPITFEVLQSLDIDQKYFGEGCAFYRDADGNGRLIEITWREQTGWIYDSETLEVLREFKYTTTPGRGGNQGWGITYNPATQEFIVSDGTQYLYMWDRDTLVETQKVEVTRFDGHRQNQLNELEFMNGLVCCNIWHSDHIICVDPDTGESVREYDMSSLWPQENRGGHENVLNGIALGRNHVLLTGKRWDRMYLVDFPDWPSLFAKHDEHDDEPNESNNEEAEDEMLDRFPPDCNWECFYDNNPQIATVYHLPRNEEGALEFFYNVWKEGEIDCTCHNEEENAVGGDGEVEGGGDGRNSDEKEEEEGDEIEPSEPAEEELEEIQEQVPKVISRAFNILEERDHDPSSFTQGLSYKDDGSIIFETTGLNRQSKVRRIHPITFDLDASIDIDGKYFGEGSTFYRDADGNGRLIEITWKAQTGFIYDSETLEKLSEFTYTTTPSNGNEGWGITYDASNQEFIVSDGTQYLYTWDRDTLAEKRKVAVTRFNGQMQTKLNELEYMDGLVCCNIWYSDDIICVDPATGKSVREYDMSSLWPHDQRGRGADVLNGIALGSDHVLITGKLWPKFYKINFEDWPSLLATGGNDENGSAEDEGEDGAAVDEDVPGLSGGNDSNEHVDEQGTEGGGETEEEDVVDSNEAVDEEQEVEEEEQVSEEESEGDDTAAEGEEEEQVESNEPEEEENDSNAPVEEEEDAQQEGDHGNDVVKEEEVEEQEGDEVDSNDPEEKENDSNAPVEEEQEVKENAGTDQQEGEGADSNEPEEEGNDSNAPIEEEQEVVEENAGTEEENEGDQAESNEPDEDAVDSNEPVEEEHDVDAGTEEEGGEQVESNEPDEEEIDTNATANGEQDVQNTISNAFVVYKQVGHDSSSFTQGLSYSDDGTTIFETSGLYGQSKVRRIDPDSFSVELSIDTESRYFGEGSTFYRDKDGNGRLIEITWKEKTGFIYDSETLELLEQFQYTTTPATGNQGWGITYDASSKEFIVSDGTQYLYIWDRDTRVEKRKVTVTRFDGGEQAKLNELEYMDGLVCCNIWHSDEIICVDPATGKSVREYDMSSLWPADQRGNSENVLNGIALGKDHVLITGKRWDRMYKGAFSDWPTLFPANG